MVKEQKYAWYSSTAVQVVLTTAFSMTSPVALLTSMALGCRNTGSLGREIEAFRATMQANLTI